MKAHRQIVTMQDQDGCPDSGLQIQHGNCLGHNASRYRPLADALDLQGEPIRVLYVLPAEGFGGAERQGVLHISKLREHGFEMVAVVGPGAPIRRALNAEGVHDYVFLENLCHDDDRPMSGLEKLKFVGAFVGDWLRTQRHLRRLIATHKVQLVFANRSIGWLAASPVARLAGVSLVWRSGSRTTSRFEDVAIGALSWATRPDLLLVNCDAVRTDLAPLMNCPTRILHNGVDTWRFDSARVRPRIREELGLGDAPVVGFPARPAPEKGMELLARVVQLTMRRVPDVHFLVAGEFGWRNHYMKQFAEEDLGERVRFLGHVDDIESFLRSCDVAVLTSRGESIEGSPNALLEAMAMELPVVATAVGGVAEAVTDGISGFLIAQDDADMFANRLTELLLNPALRQRMGSAGRAEILRRFNHDAVVAELAGVLRALVRGPPARSEA
jgi:glycosyltransferase involved in cell wall biosynthesis